MIEIPTVAGSNRFKYNNETSRKSENPETEFSELARNAGIENEVTPQVSVDYEEKFDELASVADMEIVIYTFSGEKMLFGKFTGRNVDFAV